MSKILAEAHRNPRIDFFMVIMVSGIACRHVYTMATGLPEMVVTLQLIG